MREKLIYIVTSDSGYLYAIYDNLADAERVIAERGNEFWSIDAEEMC